MPVKVQREDCELNIYEKLAKMREQVDVYKKTKSGYGYTYTPEDEILAKITQQLKKHRLLCIPEIVPGTFKVEPYTYEKTKVEKKTNQIYEEKNAEVIVSAEVVFTWINLDNPSEQLRVPWTIVGMQSDASQSFGSALTYCTRYYYLKFFNAATVDSDPDNWRSKQKAAEDAEDKAIAEEIIKLIDDFAQTYVSKQKDTDKAKADVLEIVKRYEKTGNYTKITKSVLASQLLSELQESLDNNTKEE